MRIHRNIRLLAWFNFFLDFRPYAPIAVLYFAQVTGSFTLGMAVTSITMVTTAIFEVPTGIISDLVGRKRTMLLGSIANTLCILFWAIGGSFWMLALGSVFAGSATAFFSGNNDAFLHDTLTQEGKVKEYPHFLGRTSSLFQVGLGTSALIGGFVAQGALSYAMWAGIIPSMICIVLTFFMVEPRVHAKDSETNVFRHLQEAFCLFRDNGKLRALSLASILDYGVGQAQFWFSPAFVALVWPLWAVGIARSLSHTLGFISFWFAGKVIRRLKAFQVLMGGKFISHIVILFAYITQSVFSPLLLSAMSIFFGAKMVSENTLLQKEFTHEQRATMASMNSFAGSLGFAVAAVVFGVLADRIGVTKTLIISELVLFSGLYWYWKAFKHPSK